MRENVTVGGTKYKRIQIVVHKIVDKRETAAIWYYNTFLKAGNYDLHKRTKKFKHLSLVLTETEKKNLFDFWSGHWVVFGILSKHRQPSNYSAAILLRS